MHAFRPVNNQRENYQFAFNGVLAAQAKQEEVSCLADVVLLANDVTLGSSK